MILPANLFVADKYDEVHLYVEVDPRQQGYRDYVIEDLELKLGGGHVEANHRQWVHGIHLQGHVEAEIHAQRVR